MSAARWFLSAGPIVALFWAALPNPSQADLQSSLPPLNADREVLKQAGIAPTAEALLHFFKARSAPHESSEGIDKLIAALDSPSYKERTLAGRELIRLGGIARPHLEKAAQKRTVKAIERAQECLKKIQDNSEHELQIAAIHVLTELQPDEALPTLLDFYPIVREEWTRQEILLALGRLSSGRQDFLWNTVQHAAGPRRAAAVYVLARYGSLSDRDRLRQLLGNAELTQAVGQALLGRGPMEMLVASAEDDQRLLKEHRIAADGDGALAFLKKRTLTPADEQLMRAHVQQLGDRNYKVRERAMQALLEMGTPALPFLQAAVDNADQELSRRARLCIFHIKQGPGAALPIAAIRTVARQAPKNAAAILLAYAPFADDDQVSEELARALCWLQLQSPSMDPVLMAALHDAHPARRAAAGFTLARVGPARHYELATALLRDELPTVRMRTAEGMLAAQDARAIPVLIQLLTDLPEAKTFEVEEMLYRLAGDNPPANLPAADGENARQKRAEKWSRWWTENAGKVDLALALPDHRFRGLLTICEYDSGGNGQFGRIWQCGRDHKLRWEIGGLQGPMDAQVLPNGRVLIAENINNRITERDPSGKIYWEYSTRTNPIACQRLPNGNTFIATYNEFMEVTPDKKVVYSHNLGVNFYIFSAHRMSNGRVLIMTAQGKVAELEANTGKELRSWDMGGGSWCSAEPLPNGNLLIAQQSTGQVREFDPRTGKTVWQCRYDNAFRATRLPNGNTMVASMHPSKIAEFDRAGNLRREIQCQGRPWQITWQ